MPSTALYVLRRLLVAVPVLVGVVVATFLLVRVLPGDPAAHFSTATMGQQADLERIRSEMGLDRPLGEQLLRYAQELAHARLGRSMATGNAVREDLLDRLPASIELTGVAALLAFGLGVPIGLVAGLRPGSMFDQGVRVFSAAAISVPTFVIGLMLIHVFYFNLGWAPDPTGRLGAFTSPPPGLTGLLLVDSLTSGQWAVLREAAWKITLPAGCMALFAIAPVIRTTRAAVLAAISSDFVKAGIALGLKRHLLLRHYVLRNSLVPVFTVIGMVTSLMLGANVLVEKIFAWPGVGSYALDALLSSDYAAVQGYVLLMAMAFVLVNLAVDIVNAIVDPRLRLKG